MQKILDVADVSLHLNTKPSVILVIGVNGVGKTTSIGKIANRLAQDGKKVVVAAADTFRAAAVEQLEIWAKRAGAGIVKREEGVDPASVVYDAIKITREKNADVLIVDTAGRLHNKKYLMDELNKIQKVINKEMSEADKEVLLVIDGTTGKEVVPEENNEVDAVMQTNKMMSWMMPIMSISVALVAPLGLALYWLTSNILMIIERLILNKVIKGEEE